MHHLFFTHYTTYAESQDVNNENCTCNTVVKYTQSCQCNDVCTCNDRNNADSIYAIYNTCTTRVQPDQQYGNVNKPTCGCNTRMGSQTLCESRMYSTSATDYECITRTYSNSDRICESRVGYSNDTVCGSRVTNNKDKLCVSRASYTPDYDCVSRTIYASACNCVSRTAVSCTCNTRSQSLCQSRTACTCHQVCTCNVVDTFI